MKRVTTIVTAVGTIAVSLTGLSLQPLAAQAATSVYIVAVGDIACDPSPLGDVNYAAAYNGGNGTKDGCRHKAVGAAVVAAKPDQFWALGDNQYFDGTYSKYMASYDSAFGPVKDITRPVPGNHEWKDLTLPTKPGSGYFTYFGAASHPETNGTYSFDAGDWHVLAINDNLCDLSHPCGTDSSLGKWIASDMAANQKPCTVAMWHHPLWSLGEAHKGGYVPMVPVWNQLNDLGVDMVLTGHDHNYVRTKPLGKASADPADPTKVAVPSVDPKGMVEFVIGTGGVDTYAASAATAVTMAPILAAYQAGKPSPGLFGAGGFHLESDRYTFSYLPAANSAPFTDSGGRTCRRATNGNPAEVSVAPTTTTLSAQKVTWAPTNTSIKAASSGAGTVTPSAKATTDGGGAITYAVTSRGTSGCTVDAAKGVITYSDAGQCEVTATAAATATFAEGRRAVVFTIGSTGPQNVTWAPTNTTVKAPSSGRGTITPSEKATSSGDGAITYAVTSDGTTGCSVDATKGVITYSDTGQCEVTAFAAATSAHAEGRRAMVFTITASGPVKKQDLTAVQPVSGPRAGGNTITLVGHGFTDTTKVMLDGTDAKFTVVSDTKMTVVAPPAVQEGPVTIRLTVGPPAGSIVAPAAYTYSETPASVTSPAAGASTATVGSGSAAALLGNPQAARTLASGLRLLSRAEALRVTPTVLKRTAGRSASVAATVRLKAGLPFALAIGGQPAGAVVNLRASLRGASVAVGAAQADAKGWLTMPALTATRPGLITVTLTPSPNGKPGYLKVLVVK